MKDGPHHGDRTWEESFQDYWAGVNEGLGSAEHVSYSEAMRPSDKARLKRNRRDQFRKGARR